VTSAAAIAMAFGTSMVRRRASSTACPDRIASMKARYASESSSISSSACILRE
jgi:hypothetical protein